MGESKTTVEQREREGERCTDEIAEHLNAAISAFTLQVKMHCNKDRYRVGDDVVAFDDLPDAAQEDLARVFVEHVGRGVARDYGPGFAEGIKRIFWADWLYERSAVFREMCAHPDENHGRAKEMIETLYQKNSQGEV